jgi:hypothetical protein
MPSLRESISALALLGIGGIILISSRREERPEGARIQSLASSSASVPAVTEVSSSIPPAHSPRETSILSPEKPPQPGESISLSEDEILSFADSTHPADRERARTLARETRDVAQREQIILALLESAPDSFVDELHALLGDDPATEFSQCAVEAALFLKADDPKIQDQILREIAQSPLFR